MFHYYIIISIEYYNKVNRYKKINIESNTIAEQKSHLVQEQKMSSHRSGQETASGVENLREKGTMKEEGALPESQVAFLYLHVCSLFLRKHKTSHVVSLFYTVFSRSLRGRNVDAHSIDSRIQLLIQSHILEKC